MHKQCNNELIVNRRNINTRAHDVLFMQLQRPLNEKYKRNIYYNGTIKWNELPVNNRNIEGYNGTINWNELPVNNRNIEEFNIFEGKQRKWMLETNYI